jgi:glutaredoxin 3
MIIDSQMMFLLALLYLPAVVVGFTNVAFSSKTNEFGTATTSSTNQHYDERIVRRTSSSTSLYEMKRPILDRIASSLFNLEMDRVESSSVVDEKGRVGEPMSWAQNDSLANKFSKVIAGNDLGYKFKQWVADIVAGEYDEEKIESYAKDFISNAETSGAPIAMFSFTTCPFCRGAKDYFDKEGIKYVSLELDELDGNLGNEIRSVLGKMTRRTSVPSIFVKGTAIGGLNDGTPGLMPLVESGELNNLLLQ